jgi:hypothetical protein
MLRHPTAKILKENILLKDTHEGYVKYFNVRENDYAFAMFSNQPVKIYKSPENLTFKNGENILCRYQMLWNIWTLGIQ